MNTIDYVHTVERHNVRAAEALVPIILQYFDVSSVIDIGCGTGTWLHVFNQKGIKTVGIDGGNVKKEDLLIDVKDFIAHDLRTPLKAFEKFDLAISLEVAEHLPENVADAFIDTLTNFSDQIIFSAAIPGQGGQNHLNEQWPSYWKKKFEDRGFTSIDLLRPLIWNNENIDAYYRQNVLAYVRAPERLKKSGETENQLIDVVHPEVFIYNQRSLKNEILLYRTGEIGVRGALNILRKATIALMNKFWGNKNSPIKS